jgi:hypothetical protein
MFRKDALNRLRESQQSLTDRGKKKPSALVDVGLKLS